HDLQGRPRRCVQRQAGCAYGRGYLSHHALSRFGVVSAGHQPRGNRNRRHRRRRNGTGCADLLAFNNFLLRVTTLRASGHFRVRATRPELSRGRLTMTTPPASKIMQDWPEESREAAQLVIDTYGEPQEATPSALTWHRPGPWKRISATRIFNDHRFPVPHIDS